MNGCLNRLVAGSFLALSFGLASTPAMSQAKVDNGVLTDPKGMTLYTFDKDATGSGKSACTGNCEKLWAPFTATGSASGGASSASKDYTVIQRDDGTKQWAYKGKPLYTFTKDQKPGDQSGENFNKVWHIAKP